MCANHLGAGVGLHNCTAWIYSLINQIGNILWHATCLTFTQKPKLCFGPNWVYLQSYSAEYNTTGSFNEYTVCMYFLVQGPWKEVTPGVLIHGNYRFGISHFASLWKSFSSSLTLRVFIYLFIFFHWASNTITYVMLWSSYYMRA